MKPPAEIFATYARAKFVGTTESTFYCGVSARLVVC